VNNLYATLAEFKNFATARSQGASISTDTTDDATITALIDGVSRYVDRQTQRKFYPVISTNLYDIPRGRSIVLNADLLEVTTLSNGDSSVIASTDYVLDMANLTPYYRLVLRGNSAVYWYPSATGNYQQAISLLGWYGYHSNYSGAWVLAGTLGAAITDTTTKAFTMTAGHTLTAGHIVKIDSEIYNVASVSTNTITPNQRGDNGSTAATHSNGASGYYWDVQPDIKLAVLETALGVNSMRHGQANSGKISITASGVVIRPEEVPPMAQKTFDAYRRIR
jgi:hypothetical protein